MVHAWCQSTCVDHTVPRGGKEEVCVSIFAQTIARWCLLLRYVMKKMFDEWKFISNLQKDLRLTYALPGTGKGGPTGSYDLI